MSLRPKRQPNKLPSPIHSSWNEFGLDRLPFGLLVLVLVKVVRRCSSLLQKLKWLTIIASALFGAGLLVAIATKPMSLRKIWKSFVDDVQTKEQSITPEVLPPLDLPYLPELKPARWK
jgi:hypothetical protein